MTVASITHHTIPVKTKTGWRFECTCGETGDSVRLKTLAWVQATGHMNVKEHAGGRVFRPLGPTA